MESVGSGVGKDIDQDLDWLSSLMGRMEGARLRRNHCDVPCIISRVPLHLREGDPAAYEPRIISFGPFCRDKPPLKPMEQLKLRYVQRLLHRNKNVALEEYVNLIRGLEDLSRACYSEDFEMESHEFVEMMLLDGCFLVEFLLNISYGRGYADYSFSRDDPVLTTSWAFTHIRHDMMMLENQIPFFIIQEVFKLATFGDSNHSSSHSLTDPLLWLFDDLLPCERMSLRPDTFYHVLHLVHSSIRPFKSFSPPYCSADTSPLPSPPTVLPSAARVHRAVHACVPNCTAPIYLELRKIRQLSSDIYGRVISSAHGFWRLSRVSNDPSGSSPRTPDSVPCATMLREAGVKFREKKAENFLEVAFRNGTLEIPTLLVQDGTNRVFRNLIAFEQCFDDVGTHVATYAAFMDYLINSKEDVALLCGHGCLVNMLGSDEEVAQIFNRLCKEVLFNFDSCYLASVFKEVKKHCDSKWNKNRAKLMHDYFSSPWSFLSLLGALIIILLTVVQTSFAILAYFNPQPTS